jgi:hypothetical protein
MADKPQIEGLKAAMDTAKQIITLSTGVIALTVTFLEKIVQPSLASAARNVPWPLSVAWIVFGLAIVFAVWTLMALTGTLNAMDRRANGLTLSEAQQTVVDAYGDNVQVPAVGMVLCFLVAISLTIGAGFFL